MALAVDSSAVVAFLDSGDALHAESVTAFRKELVASQIFASSVTYAEVLAGAFIGHHDVENVRGFFTDIVSAVLPIDEAVADIAAEIRSAAGKLKMPDALILATAHVHPEIDSLLTGDAEIARSENLVNVEVRVLSAS